MQPSATTRVAATGFVLAGGRSTRMGQDKVLLPWVEGGPENKNESTLLELALGKLRIVCGEARICSNRLELGKYAPVIPDMIAPVEAENAGSDAKSADANGSIGPLGGMVAALETTTTEWNLFLAVDLPVLPVEFLAALLERAQRAGASAVVPYLAGRPQPLCAVLHRSLLPGLWQAVAEGKYKVMLALEAAAGMLPGQGSGLERYEVDAAQSAWFLNLNSPEDLALAQSLNLQR